MAISFERRHIIKSMPYDSEVEYIKADNTTGLCYIDTHCVPNIQDTDIYVKFLYSQNPSNGAIMMGTTDNTKTYRISKYTNGIIMFNGSAIFYNNNMWSGATAGKMLDVKLFGKARKWDINDGAASGSLGTYAATVTNTNSFIIGNESTNIALTLYYFKIIQAGEIILDLVPVRKDNIGYMYDKVSGKLFGNSGDGKFIIGPDIN